jgi:hypothetical protein
MAALSLTCVSASTGDLAAYDVPAHRLLTLRATDPKISSIDRVLKELGFREGNQTRFLGLAAVDWIRDGAGLEDSPATRVVHHFHNPLASSWDSAGLTVGGPVGLSSVVWQQKADQNHGPGITGAGSWAWPNARARYREALTLSSRDARESALAALFRSLGQIVHLIQDASVPAHVRNDQHLKVTIGGITLYDDSDGYEGWVAGLAANPADFIAFLEARPPIGPSSEIFKLAVAAPRIDREKAPSRISALIDTGQYNGSNPDITRTPLIGLAEYANANFFSKDSNSLADESVLMKFPYPARSSVALSGEVSNGREIRRYFSKVGDGDTVEFLAVPSLLYEFLPDALRDRKIGLDGVVLNSYAHKLLPRAVGYSAALLDYFFRGDLDVSFDSDGLTIVNRTADEAMAGTFEVYYDTKDDVRVFLGSWSLTLAPDQSSGVLTVPQIRKDLRSKDPESFYLVFSGTLGAEDGAVVAKRITREPIKGAWGVMTFAQYVNGALWSSETNAYPLNSMYPWFMLLDQVNYQTTYLGTTQIYKLFSVNYRDPREVPVQRLTLSAVAFCFEGGITAIPAEIVEFVTPLDLEELKAYDYVTNLPEVKRVLARVDPVPWYAPATVILDEMAGLRFFGIRSSAYPSGYPGVPTRTDYDVNGCAALGGVIAAE